jgi:5-oxoprolinase (ATP-hydrolysing)
VNNEPIAELRLRGQDTPIQVEYKTPHDLPQLYREAYQRLFGYPPPANREIELVSIRTITREESGTGFQPVQPSPGAQRHVLALEEPHPRRLLHPRRRAGLEHRAPPRLRSHPPPRFKNITHHPSLERDLLRHRFHAIVTDMGALLCRTAISTNIRERLDFSCALLDPHGRLLSSAPHIPVHLGALGECVREVAGHCLHAAGRYHHHQPSRVWRIALTRCHAHHAGLRFKHSTRLHRQSCASCRDRRHHARLDACERHSLDRRRRRHRSHDISFELANSCFDEVSTLLTTALHPTRNLADNLADLHAQLAANLHGVERLRALAAIRCSKTC